MEVIFIALLLQQPGPINQLDGGAEPHGVSPAEGEHARMEAENRMFHEMKNDQPNLPLDGGSFPAVDNDHGQKAPSQIESTRV